MPAPQPKRPRKRPSAHPARSRSYSGPAIGLWLRPAAIGLIGFFVFAALFILDTGAILRLFWMSLSGSLGLGACFLAAFIAMTALLPLALAMWRKLVQPSVAARPAQRRKTQRSGQATSKTTAASARKKNSERSA